jgi:phage gp46-like protein
MDEENDIHLECNEIKGFYDLELVADGSDLLGAVNLRTAIGISIFTDRRSNSDDLIPNQGGWPGDSIRPDNEDLLGSKLWMYYTEIAIDEHLPPIEDTVRESVQWLLDDNVAKEITVSAFWVSKPNGILQINTDVTQFDGTGERYEYVWNQKLVA